MEELELLGNVPAMDAMGVSPRLFHSCSECFLSEWQFEGEPGSWSRGYDVALTWRRSQVQFLPSPPIESILLIILFKIVGYSQSSLTLVLLADVPNPRDL